MKKISNYKKWDYNQQEDWCFQSKFTQSPINIQTDQVQPLIDEGNILVNYDTVLSDVFDTGCAIQGNVSGHAMINGRRFKLKQFHFHAHSEHTIDGTKFPLELHLVHQAQNGHYAVLAIFIQIGKNAPDLEPIVESFHTLNLTKSLNLEGILPNNRTYFHYEGSLTTPPLTENVEWYIFKSPIEISQSQFQRLTERYSQNHRNQQDLNQRPVLYKEIN
ncbi:carbonic anhydrase family protein [Vagococcus silagei]|uniref:Carbonic anhydrase n=1 Tax=Vagococcus silagei TaxID=2508885 RepID=A0A4S3B8U0_9ENTE|nr:carbonic anhydrase family protein [Vagococcus silagei]THB62316.1 carbonic anhydrase family protein [Vagococcus silagei]